jgi:hypothetical protein
MKTAKQACQPRQSIFDATMRDTALNVESLVHDRIDPAAFFDENHMTQGMRLLLENGFKRLEGKSDQGIFRLTQAMGGGKTHNLIAFGLLAKHPELRARVMSKFYTPGVKLGEVRVVAFTGRESDAPLGVWGAIAEQLGRKELFNPYYSPLQAPGKSAWVNLLKGEPLVILLDELPFYFVSNKSRQIGNSDLSVVTGIGLANLFVAVTDELPDVCVVITDLKAVYEEGSQQINQALNTLHDEANRVAMDLEPVRMNTDEFYHILRKRIFETLPRQQDIEEVAQAFGKAVREARQMDITSASPEQFAAQVAESYPFHPAIRDLYARFKENQGFQQTRGVIRLMRKIVARLWESHDIDPYLIGAHHVDLNHQEIFSEIRNINPTLEAAIAHDIADNGKAVAERIDANKGGADARDIAKLLLISSLSTVPHGVKGLLLPEVTTYLCEPKRDVSQIKATWLDLVSGGNGAWYLHPTADGKWYFKNVENLTAKLNSMAQSYLPEQSARELKDYLMQLFETEKRWCYQDILALPAIDEIRQQQDRVLLLIAQWHPNGLNPDLQRFFENAQYQNRLLFLTGQRSFDAMMDNARRFKAIRQIVGELAQERKPSNDPEVVQAQEMLDKVRGQLLMSVKETFTTLHYPNKNGVANTEFIMRFTGNEYHGEQQIIDTLKEAQKYTEEMTGDIFVKKVEARLFTQKQMPWSEIKKRAATNINWQWHHPNALDQLKEECLRKDIWREEGGFVEKGPFPRPASSVTVQVISRDDETGAVKLRLTPVNADEVYADQGNTATVASQKLRDKIIETHDLEMSFLAVDSSGEHPQGETVTWRNTITIKWRPQWVGKELRVELKAAPNAPIRYTTDGSNPKIYGGTYEGPFIVPAGARVIQAVAERDGIVSDIYKFDVPQPGAGEKADFKLDPHKPALWTKQHYLNNTQATYEFIGRAQKHKAALIGGELQIVSKNNSERWLQFGFGDDISIAPADLETTLTQLRDMIREGDVTLRANKLQFESGQHLLDFVDETRADLNASEVKQ